MTKAKNTPARTGFAMVSVMAGLLFSLPLLAGEPAKPEKACQSGNDCVLVGPACEAVNKAYAKPEEIKRCEEKNQGKPFGNDFAGCINHQCAVGVHF